MIIRSEKWLTSHNLISNIMHAIMLAKFNVDSNLKIYSLFEFLTIHIKQIFTLVRSLCQSRQPRLDWTFSTHRHHNLYFLRFLIDVIHWIFTLCTKIIIGTIACSLVSWVTNTAIFTHSIFTKDLAIVWKKMFRANMQGWAWTRWAWII